MEPHCTMLPRKDLSRLSIYFSHMEVYDASNISPCLTFLPLESFCIKEPFLWDLFAANPFITNDDCNTALDLAREKGHVNVVRAIEVYSVPSHPILLCYSYFDDLTHFRWLLFGS